MVSTEALREHLARMRPDAAIEQIAPLEPDITREQEGTAKSIGYGVPVRVTLRNPDGSRSNLVFHTAGANDFDHDRRSDRAKNILLAYDTIGTIPHHVAPVDVGAVTDEGHLISLADTGEFYIVTDFAPGDVYADDLRRIATEQVVTGRDEHRCERLAQVLAALHTKHEGRPALYRRSVRNLVGDGEGIFGIIDGYPDDVPGADSTRLHAIEQSCVEWRWKLRDSESRCARIHGDFHPFNILFDEDNEVHLLDASRGCHGDPADDVTCLAINYLFFALEHDGSWETGLKRLWRRIWQSYFTITNDQLVLDTAPPYLAWRALVLANPRWYPLMQPDVRNRLLGFAEETLHAGSLIPERADKLF